MKIVIDTNILLVSISDRSPYHIIFKNFIDGKFQLCVTTDILSEYEEIIGRLINQITADAVLKAIENSPNTILIEKFFRFDLIKADADDNKFVDCAIASNADFIVTNDRHFQALTSIPFPRVNILKIDDFINLLR
ncbi:MAG: putative toxin-antitoxin system toxin component, PIN family [Cytophagaceae bacterium]|nr:putative toxin-antitoxin system toxin component, PIN family [Cytophagaceae bacterium]